MDMDTIISHSTLSIDYDIIKPLLVTDPSGIVWINYLYRITICILEETVNLKSTHCTTSEDSFHSQNQVTYASSICVSEAQLSSRCLVSVMTSSVLCMGNEHEQHINLSSWSFLSSVHRQF
jgi:hypothetical protein